MRASWMGLALGVALLSGPAIAQLPQGQGFDLGQNAQTPSPPTRFEQLNQSLEQLLNAGYQIRTTMMGVLVLAKPADGEKTSWVMCGLDVAEGLMDGTPGNYRPPSARCFALN